MLWLQRLIREEDGQDLIEYGLLAAFISLTVVAVVDAVGGSLGTAYDSFAGEIDSFGASS